jgi:hypothetical protein
VKPVKKIKKKLKKSLRIMFHVCVGAYQLGEKNYFRYIPISGWINCENARVASVEGFLATDGETSGPP